LYWLKRSSLRQPRPCLSNQNNCAGPSFMAKNSRNIIAYHLKRLSWSLARRCCQQFLPLGELGMPELWRRPPACFASAHLLTYYMTPPPQNWILSCQLPQLACITETPLSRAGCALLFTVFCLFPSVSFWSVCTASCSGVLASHCHRSTSCKSVLFRCAIRFVLPKTRPAI